MSAAGAQLRYSGAYVCTCGWQKSFVSLATHIRCERCSGVAVFMHDAPATTADGTPIVPPDQLEPEHEQ